MKIDISHTHAPREHHFLLFDAKIWLLGDDKQTPSYRIIYFTTGMTSFYEWIFLYKNTKYSNFCLIKTVGKNVRNKTDLLDEDEDKTKQSPENGLGTCICGRGNTICVFVKCDREKKVKTIESYIIQTI